MMATKASEAPSKGALRQRGDPLPRFRRPWWERDREVAKFVFSAIGAMAVTAIPAACAERFGSGRAPSKSGVARYMTHLRGGPFRGAKKSPRRRRRKGAAARPP